MKSVLILTVEAVSRRAAKTIKCLSLTILIAAFGVSLLAASAPIRSTDRIVLKNGLKIDCQILSETLDAVTVRFSSGKIHEYRRSQIASVERSKPVIVKKIDALLLQGKVSDALALCARAAADATNSAWIRECALRRRIEIHELTGRTTEALRDYFSLLRLFPRTPFFAAVPMPLDETEADKGVVWIEKQNISSDFAAKTAKAVRAIYLFMARRKIGDEIKKDLISSPDARLAGFGEIVGALIVAQQDARRGVQAFRSCARTLRPPFLPLTYVLLGVVQRRQRDWIGAATAFLRPPLLFPTDGVLAGYGLRCAVTSVREAGDDALLTRLVKLWKKRFPYAEISGLSKE